LRTSGRGEETGEPASDSSAGGAAGRVVGYGVSRCPMLFDCLCESMSRPMDQALVRVSASNADRREATARSCRASSVPESETPSISRSTSAEPSSRAPSHSAIQPRRLKKLQRPHDVSRSPSVREIARLCRKCAIASSGLLLAGDRTQPARHVRCRKDPRSSRSGQERPVSPFGPDVVAGAQRRVAEVETAIAMVVASSIPVARSPRSKSEQART